MKITITDKTGTFTKKQLKKLEKDFNNSKEDFKKAIKGGKK